MANMGAQVATQANETKGEYEYYEYDVYNYNCMHAGQPEKVREEVPNTSNTFRLQLTRPVSRMETAFHPFSNRCHLIRLPMPEAEKLTVEVEYGGTAADPVRRSARAPQPVNRLIESCLFHQHAETYLLSSLNITLSLQLALQTIPTLSIVFVLLIFSIIACLISEGRL